MSKDETKTVESKWVGRSLSGYKATHAKTAEDRGVADQFKKAATISQAKKVLFGTKKGNSPLRK